MKILIITALSTFVIATGITMALTGTRKKITSRFSEPADTEQTAVTEEAQEEGEKSQPQEAGKPESRGGDTAASDAGLQVELVEYEAQIAAAEAKLAAIKAEIESLNGVKASITNGQRLAKVYSSMRPDSAASILCELEEPLTKQILSEMNNRTVGKIMDAIATANPSCAARISKLMADAGDSDS